MPDVRPLPIYGTVEDADRECLRLAKAEINPPYFLTLVEAFPGSPGRILAFRETPPFICDYALVTNPDHYESVRGALYWVLHPEYDDPRSSLVLDQLQAIFGPDVKEMHEGPHFE
jgi:hypothetical protein